MGWFERPSEELMKVARQELKDNCRYKRDPYAYEREKREHEQKEYQKRLLEEEKKEREEYFLYKRKEERIKYLKNKYEDSK